MAGRGPGLLGSIGGPAGPDGVETGGTMKPMFLKSVDQGTAAGPYATAIQGLEAAGAPVPQIMRLFAFRPDRTAHLAHYTHGAMRGPSPLSPGLRELIAAYTSRLNHCPF